MFMTSLNFTGPFLDTLLGREGSVITISTSFNFRNSDGFMVKNFLTFNRINYKRRKIWKTFPNKLAEEDGNKTSLKNFGD